MGETRKPEEEAAGSRHLGGLEITSPPFVLQALTGLSLGCTPGPALCAGGSDSPPRRPLRLDTLRPHLHSVVQESWARGAGLERPLFRSRASEGLGRATPWGPPASHWTVPYSFSENPSAQAPEQSSIQELGDALASFHARSEGFLKTQENKLFLQPGPGEASLQSIDRGHILLERQGRWAAGVTRASLGVARAITPLLPSSKPSPPVRSAHPHVASTVKIDLEKKSICLPFLSGAGSW